MDNLIEIPYFDEFCEELQNSLSSSANAYKSYMNSATDLLANEKGFFLGTKLHNVTSLNDLEVVLESAIMLLEDCEAKKKTLSNYKSALRKYFDCLRNMYPFQNETFKRDVVNGVSDKKMHDCCPENQFCITHDELYSAFKHRLETDDRFKVGGIYIPMRLIKFLLERDADFSSLYEEWVKMIIDNTIVVTERGTIHLRNIRGISIKRPYFLVHFRLDCAEPVLLYTYTDRPGIIVPYTSYSVDRNGMANNLLNKKDVIADMTREHFPESSVVAICPTTEFKALPIITEICKEYNINSGKQLQDALSNNPKFVKDVVNKVILRDLLDDLYLIDSYQSVTIMKRSLNIKKGGKKGAFQIGVCSSDGL